MEQDLLSTFRHSNIMLAHIRFSYLFLLLWLISMRSFGQDGSPCIPASQGWDEAYCNAQVVFRGVPIVDTLAVANIDAGKQGVVGRSRVSFLVFDVIKGAAGNTIHIYLPADSMSEQVQFVPAEEYLVFAVRNMNAEVLSVDPCGRTQLVSELNESDLDSLRISTRYSSYIGNYVPKTMCFNFPVKDRPSKHQLSFSSDHLTILGDQVVVDTSAILKIKNTLCSIHVTYANVAEKTFEKMNARVSVAAMPAIGKELLFKETSNDDGVIIYSASMDAGLFHIRSNEAEHTVEVCYPPLLPIINR